MWSERTTPRHRRSFRCKERNIRRPKSSTERLFHNTNCNGLAVRSECRIQLLRCSHVLHDIVTNAHSLWLTHYLAAPNNYTYSTPFSLFTTTKSHPCELRDHCYSCVWFEYSRLLEPNHCKRAQDRCRVLPPPVLFSELSWTFQ